MNPDWTPLTPFWAAMGTRSFVSSDDDPDRIQVRYFSDGEGRTWAQATFGPGTEGPPGHVHGGALAALLDETMGMAALATGHIVVAARIEVDFRTLVPLGEPVTIETTVGAVQGTKVPVRATLRRANGTAATEATGLFVDVGAERLGRAAEGARP